MPDAYNIFEISKAFGVISDYLLNDDFDSDADLPQIREVKKDNHILHLNLTKIAIIVQAAFLNVAMQPFQVTDGVNKTIEIMMKLLPLLLASAWMAHNLKYEKDTKKYRKNVMIELAYCMAQAAVFLFGYFSKMYFVGTTLLIAIAIIYLLFINPKYMNRQLVRKGTTDKSKCIRAWNDLSKQK